MSRSDNRVLALAYLEDRIAIRRRQEAIDELAAGLQDALSILAGLRRTDLRAFNDWDRYRLTWELHGTLHGASYPLFKLVNAEHDEYWRRASAS